MMAGTRHHVHVGDPETRGLADRVVDQDRTLSAMLAIRSLASLRSAGLA
jgi:hypothetical protein